MTLPFVSYGGSSTLALAIGMGMILALTRERPGDLGLRRMRSTKVSGAGLLEKLAPGGVG
jgi:cell division protein FtsW